ncbi:MAG: MucB/RseB C-terminal domain-containing protein [Burkholderiales bacterium]|nr:MucB/RseB C-terminal domain-containing protein [Burkholderiales bacterium]
MKSWSKSQSVFAALIAGTGLFAGIAGAQTGHRVSPASPPPLLDAREWLDRIAKSARELPYTGVFIQQTADGVSTSRITHLVDRQGVELEKLEMLDGPQTEIIRRNEEMFCYHPDAKIVRVDRRISGRFFPSLISGNPKLIADNYRVSLGNVERVAGFDCQWVILEPRDAMRYMQKLCAELGTGLLLRARLYSDRNQMLEQFMFTQLDLSRSVAKQSLKSRFEQLPGWQTNDSAKSANAAADTGWKVANLPAGFKKVAEMIRTMAGRSAPVSQLVFSDGLSHVSVFVEPMRGDLQTSGARMTDDSPIAFAMRPVADHQVTVMGEVPVAAVQAIADSVMQKRR